jgi:hypothetical protein
VEYKRHALGTAAVGCPWISPSASLDLPPRLGAAAGEETPLLEHPALEQDGVLELNLNTAVGTLKSKRS